MSRPAERSVTPPLSTVRASGFDRVGPFAEVAEAVSVVVGAGVFYKLGDPKEGILVNVGGGRSGKFLKAGVVLELNPGKSDNVVDGKVSSVAETKILDTTMQFLRAAPLEEFDASKQDALKKQLKDALNERLGQGSVYDVYITSFLLQ